MPKLDFGEAITRIAERIERATEEVKQHHLGEMGQHVVEGLRSAQKIVREEYERVRDGGGSTARGSDSGDSGK